MTVGVAPKPFATVALEFVPPTVEAGATRAAEEAGLVVERAREVGIEGRIRQLMIQSPRARAWALARVPPATRCPPTAQAWRLSRPSIPKREPAAEGYISPRHANPRSRCMGLLCEPARRSPRRSGGRQPSAVLANSHEPAARFVIPSTNGRLRKGSRILQADRCGESNVRGRVVACSPRLAARRTASA